MSENYNENEYAEIILPVIMGLYEKENIPFDGWFIFEIPVWREPFENDYISIVVMEKEPNRSITLKFDKNNELTEVSAMDKKDNLYKFTTIQETLNSIHSYY